jgi:hypothetical protein
VSFGYDEDENRDYDEEAYNERLMHGGDELPDEAVAGDTLTMHHVNLECPAGGEHEWGTLEETGTGRTAPGCENCGTSPPKEEHIP